MIYGIARLNIYAIPSIYLEKTERSETINLQSSIVNIQFPDKTGFRLRWNPASGISAALRPAKLARVGLNITN